MEVRALFGRFVWRGINIYEATIHPSRGSRINPTLKQDSKTGEFRFRTACGTSAKKYDGAMVQMLILAMMPALTK